MYRVQLNPIHYERIRVYRVDMVTNTVPSRLIGRAELMLLLGVSRGRAVVLSQEAAFPAPRDRLIMGNVWELDDVIAWSEWRGRVLNLHALPDPDHPNTPEPAPPRG